MGIDFSILSPLRWFSASFAIDFFLSECTNVNIIALLDARFPVYKFIRAFMHQMHIVWNKDRSRNEASWCSRNRKRCHWIFHFKSVPVVSSWSVFCTVQKVLRLRTLTSNRITFYEEVLKMSTFLVTTVGHSFQGLVVFLSSSHLFCFHIVKVLFHLMHIMDSSGSKGLSQLQVREMTFLGEHFRE